MKYYYKITSNESPIAGAIAGYTAYWGGYDVNIPLDNQLLDPLSKDEPVESQIKRSILEYVSKFTKSSKAYDDMNWVIIANINTRKAGWFGNPPERVFSLSDTCIDRGIEI